MKTEAFVEFLYDYGLFLAKAVTLVAAIVIVLAAIAGIAAKQKQGKGHLEITSISDQLKDITDYARQVILDKASLKKLAKAQKKEQKLYHKQEKVKVHLLNVKQK